jgi:multiple sugar transport system permease protein
MRAVAVPEGEKIKYKPYRLTHAKDYLVAYVFIIPSLAGFIIFFGVPAIRGLLLSFTDWDLLSPSKFIGFENYAKLFQDSEFWNSLWVTIQYVVENVPIQTLSSLLIAVLMAKVGTSMAFRGVMLIPWLLPNVVVALLWSWLLDPAFGFFNELIKNAGHSPLPFLTSTAMALPSVVGINIWRHMGYIALLIFAGIQSIPKEIDEAALIDGAGPWRAFFSVTMPLLRPVLAFVVITAIIGSFQIYDTVAIATKGGPVQSTWVLNFLIFKTAFQGYQMGYATAITMVLFVILIGITYIQMRLMRAGEAD